MGQACGGPALLLLLLIMLGDGQAISHQVSAAPPRWRKVTTDLSLDHIFLNQILKWRFHRRAFSQMEDSATFPNPQENQEYAHVEWKN
jgi:hypothetical protein